MALPENTIKISEMTSSSELGPQDYVPIVRYDSQDQDYDNYKVAAKEFISYPRDYLWCESFAISGSSVIVDRTYCRDATNSANIFITSSITKTINSSLFTSSSEYTTSGTKYFLVCRVSEQDPTATFFVSSTNNALPTGYAYSRAIGQGYWNASTLTFSNVWGYDNKIDVVQTADITAGSALTNGHIALVIE